MNELDKVALDNYTSNLSEELKQWCDSEGVPEILWERVNNVVPGTSVAQFIRQLMEQLLELYGEKRDKGESFADSRFTPIDQMIERGMVSCGALALIFAEALRQWGIPVKLIHGRLEGSPEGHMHAWIEVFNVANGIWVPVDPASKDFQMQPTAIKIKEYHNWEELGPDYEKGDY